MPAVLLDGRFALENSWADSSILIISSNCLRDPSSGAPDNTVVEFIIIFDYIFTIGWLKSCLTVAFVSKSDTDIEKDLANFIGIGDERIRIGYERYVRRYYKTGSWWSVYRQVHRVRQHLPDPAAISQSFP